MAERLLLEGAEALGITLSEKMEKQFADYHGFLEEKNRVMNLTAISGWEDTVKLHFLDCLAMAGKMRFNGAKVIDIGSGAGFPGVPLAIAVPGMQLVAVDAQRKRTDFLSELFSRLDLKNAVAIHGRAEELAGKSEYRERFDFGVSRAVAGLNILCELSLPFIAVGGIFVAMKSTESDEEIRAAGNAIRKLGGKIAKTVDYLIPGTDIVHRLVIISKEEKTPGEYPRRFAKIQKSPL